MTEFNLWRGPGADALVKLWNSSADTHVPPVRQKPVRILDDNKQKLEVLATAFSVDGKTLATAGLDAWDGPEICESG